jgi:hypothetical protein
MTCSASCGSQRELVELLIKNAINEALAKGDIQAGLKDCDGGALGKDSKVILCGALASAVNEAIKNGEIDVVKDVTIENGKLKVTKGDGKEKEIELPFVQMAIGDKEVVLTNPNGEHVAVPKASDVLTADDFDKTIVKGANETDKLGVKVKPNGGLEATEDGVGIKAGDGLKFGEDGSLQVGEIFANKPILGKGTKADPLKLALNSDQFNVNAATGEVSLKPTDSSLIKNLNTGIQKVGYSTFYGYIGKARGDYVPGVPADINSTNATENATSEISQLADGQAYDFNGWQIASPAQVDQYLVGTDQAVWHRVNDSGMNKDGTLVDPTNWSVWHRETNVTANVMQIEAMQKQVDDLTKRVGALEDILSKFANLKDASGEVLLGAIKP